MPSRFVRKRPFCGYRFYRGVLAISGCVLASLLFTFCLHYQLSDDWNLSDGGQLLLSRTSFETSPQHQHLRNDRLSAQTPRQLSSVDHNTTAIATDIEAGDVKVVHIVYTRFMQHQSNLTSLGLARVELFREFFLASLSIQSTENFLVVIRADPQLQPSVRGALIRLLDEYAAFNYVLMGSNENLPNSHQYPDLLERLSNSSDNATIDSTSLLEGSIWSGDRNAAREYIQSAHRQSKNHGSIVIETRLDSDDGLHRQYLEYLQRQATSTIGHDHDHASPWTVSCAGKYIEWQVVAPWEGKGDKKVSEGVSRDTKTDDDPYSGLGSLVSLQFKGCLSAGLSVAYFPFKDQTDVPILRNHESIAETIRHCRGKEGKIKHKANCLDFVALNPSVLRARTPTSAGMLNVLWNWESTGQSTASEFATTNPLYQKYESGARKQRKFQELLWKTVHYFFGFDEDRVRVLRQYLHDNMVEIAKDNLQGQCSAGHSCKNSSQAMLRSIVSSGTAAVQE